MAEHQYGENGFVPTVTNHSWNGDTIVYETLDPREETDLVGVPDEPLQRVADIATDEQQEVLALYERN